MKRENLQKVIAGLIAAMFFYAAVSKLADLDESRHEMRNQIFPEGFADILLFLVPGVELIMVLTLLYVSTRLMALYASLTLLILFTAYIAITMSGAFGHIPCSCGGILKHMGYGVHLIFNLFFIVLALWGIEVEKGWSINNKWFDNKRKEFAGN